MGVSIIKSAGKFAGILSSFTFLIVGTNVLLRAMSLDFDTVLYAMELAVPSAIVAGLLGHFIGKVFDSPKKAVKSPIKNSNKKADLLIDDLLVNDLDKVNEDVDKL